MKFGIAGDGEIAFFSVIHPFFINCIRDGFGDDEMAVGVTLAVGMGDHVDRQAVDGEIDIGAMVVVEAAEEYLFCLSPTLVLTDEEAGDDAEDFLGVGDATHFYIRLAHVVIRVSVGSGDHDVFEEGVGCVGRPLRPGCIYAYGQ